MGKATFLLDAGINIERIQKVINLNQIDFAYISHRHKDHSKSAEKLRIRGVSIVEGMIYQDFTKVALKTKYERNLAIFVFPVEHGEEKNSGFIAVNYDTGEQMLYITDFNVCKYDLSDFKFDKILVECNFVEANLPAHLDFKSLRQINTHMGLNGLKVFLKGLNLTRTKEILLCHMSGEYGDKEIMQKQIQREFKMRTGVCMKNGGVYYG